MSACCRHQLAPVARPNKMRQIGGAKPAHTLKNHRQFWRLHRSLSLSCSLYHSPSHHSLSLSLFNCIPTLRTCRAMQISVIDFYDRLFAEDHSALGLGVRDKCARGGECLCVWFVTLQQVSLRCDDHKTQYSRSRSFNRQ